MSTSSYKRTVLWILLVFAPTVTVNAQTKLAESQKEFEVAFMQYARSAPRVSLMNIEKLPVEPMYVIEELKSLTASKAPSFRLTSASIEVSLQSVQLDDIIATNNRVWYWKISATLPPMVDDGITGYLQTERFVIVVFMNRAKVAGHFSGVEVEGGPLDRKNRP